MHKVICLFPCIASCAVTLSMNFVLELLAVDMTVENLLDDVFLFTGNLDRLRRRRLLDALVVPRTKLVDVEDRVDLEPVRELELVVQVTDLGEDLERSQLARAELGRGLIDAEILRAEANLIANLEEVSALLCGLVLFFHLGFGLSQSRFSLFANVSHAVEPFVKGRDFCMLSSQNREVRRIAIDNLEGCALGSTGNMRVQSELGHRKPINPVVLALGDEETQEFLYFLVLALDLAIAFWVIRGGEASSDAETLVERTHVLSRKLGSSVGEDLAGESMETEDVCIVDVAHAGCGDRGVDGHKVTLIRVVIYVDRDGVLLSLGVARELRDEVHTDMFPRSRGDFLRL